MWGTVLENIGSDSQYQVPGTRATYAGTSALFYSIYGFFSIVLLSVQGICMQPTVALVPGT